MAHPYQHKTAFYREGRRGYAEEAVELIAEMVAAPRARVVDMGSGTGLFSASLLEKGLTVYCVEPDGAFRQTAEERLRRFEGYRAVAAPAEATGLPAHSVDGVAAASAFHWFDPQGFRRECRRILKPGGYVFLLYNVRRIDDALGREQQRICRKYCPGFVSLRHGVDKAKERCPAFFSGGCGEKRYPHDLVYTEEQFLSRCLSSSYSLSRTQPDYPAYRGELERLIAEHSAHGLLTVGNHTAVWYGTVE